MVAFDPISLVVEGLSQIALFFIDGDVKNQIDESNRRSVIYSQLADSSKEDAMLYQLYTTKALKQQEQTILLTKQALKQNASVVYTLWFVFILAFFLIFWVFKIAFSKVKKSVS